MPIQIFKMQLIIPKQKVVKTNLVRRIFFFSQLILLMKKEENVIYNKKEKNYKIALGDEVEHEKDEVKTSKRYLLYIEVS